MKNASKVLDGLAYASLTEKALVAKLAAKFTTLNSLPASRAAESVRETCPPRGSTQRLIDAVRLEHSRQHAIRAERLKNQPYKEPDVTGPERLRLTLMEKTEKAVLRSYSRCGYRRAQGKWAGGDHTTTIKISPAEAGVTSRSTKSWSSNGKWSGRDSEHRIHVQPTWRAEVLKKYPTGTITVKDKECLILCVTADQQLKIVRQGRGFELVPDWIPAP